MHNCAEHDPVSRSRSNLILHLRTASGLDWILKKHNRIRYGYPNCIDHCSKLLKQSFFGYKPDWIKYLDRSAGLGSERISQRKFDWIRIPNISYLFNTDAHPSCRGVRSLKCLTPTPLLLRLNTLRLHSDAILSFGFRLLLKLRSELFKSSGYRYACGS